VSKTTLYAGATGSLPNIPLEGGVLFAELIVNVDFIKSPDFVCSEKLIIL
jgi:hypothetical protein